MSSVAKGGAAGSLPSGLAHRSVQSTSRLGAAALQAACAGRTPWRWKGAPLQPAAPLLARACQEDIRA